MQNDKPSKDATESSFPLASLRQFLLPDSLLSVKLFEAASLTLLEAAINEWVMQTQNVVAVIGSISELADGRFMVGVTFVPAVS